MFKRLINLNVVLLRYFKFVLRLKNCFINFIFRQFLELVSFFKHTCFRWYYGAGCGATGGRQGSAKGAGQNRIFRIWDEQDLFFPALVFVTWQRNDSTFFFTSFPNRLSRNFLLVAIKKSNSVEEILIKVYLDNSERVIIIADNRRLHENWIRIVIA